MDQDRFSPLALNIRDLLKFPCRNQEEGCQVKMKKKELEEHEKEECIFTEKLQCPGCILFVAVFILPDHFKDCSKMIHNRMDQSRSLDTDYSAVWFMELPLERIHPVVFKLENSNHWFILLGEKVEDKFVFYLMHFCGEEEEEKETFYFNLKISGDDEQLSRSMTGKCAPVGMGVEEARRKGLTLDIDTGVLKEMLNPDHKQEGEIYEKFLVYVIRLMKN